MAKARWLVPWKDSRVKPAHYHCVVRVVDRRLAFGPDDKEHFRMLMRRMEKFSGCRVLAYCLMCNHIHILLEVPPPPEGGVADEELLKRLRGLYPESYVAEVAGELAAAREAVAAGLAPAGEDYVQRIHRRFTYRMHNLSEFMKTLLQRFTRWHNKRTKRSGNLWEETFKSVIVEDGVAARAIAAYIDLNPVRAGMVADPAAYRWSSYGEAIGGGARGSGKTARAGLVRACLAHEGAGFEADRWQEVARIYRRLMGMALGQRSGRAAVVPRETGGSVTRNTAELMEADDNESALPDLKFAAMLRCRIRYFTDGAVIGSRAFVNDVFEKSRGRFGPRRKDGARRLRGHGAPAAGVIWSMRDLRVDV